MDTKALSTKLASLALQSRPSQMDMIESSFKALNSNRIICIEAPTGTGKTLSYLLASYHAKQKNQTVVISTATIALQEQLVQKDLPLAAKILGEPISWTLAKGRRRYVCNARLHEAEQQKDLLFDQDTLARLQKKIASRTWSGDRDQLSKPVKEELWQEISTDSAGCSGKRCDFYEDCVFYRNKKKMHTSDFIVTNHNLLLADLELGGGMLLTDPEKTIYLLDECHHLPEKALSHFARSTSLSKATEWVNQINIAINRMSNAKEISLDIGQNVNQCTLKLIETIKEQKAFIDDNQKQFKDNEWRITTNDPAFFTVANHLVKISSELYSYVERVIDNLEEHHKKHEKSDPELAAQINKRLSQFGFLAHLSSNFYETWLLFCSQQKKGDAPIAKWFELDNHVVHCAPINISKELTNCFWNNMTNGALLCSATIQSLGQFDNYLRKTGLKSQAHLETKIIPSCFDYEKSFICVPEMKSEPTGMQQEAHRKEVCEILPNLILPNTGTLVLFTSKKAMNDTFAAMPPGLCSDILLQGERSKMKLIEQHKNKIDNGERSILFGLASFAEGLDLPAEYCQHVIIHKLPFAVPTTPIELTRQAWLQQHNKNGFMLTTLPDTSTKLTQYVGRLIRQESDFGLVTILDRRLYTKNYGSNLLANLPPFTQLIRFDHTKLKTHDGLKKLFNQDLRTTSVSA